jgi:thioredoxin reductase (NADPH)
MWDCMIVGGGAAGLTAATYLGRFRRSVLVIDAGESRMKRIPLSRNVPGFPDGVCGADLHDRMQRHAAAYGAAFMRSEATRLDKLEGGFAVSFGGRVEHARCVLLATGAQLNEPELDNLDNALAQGVLRYCPICDGYEAQNRKVAVLGGRRGAIEEAKFLRTYTSRITYLWCADAPPTCAEREDAARLGIEVAALPVAEVSVRECVTVRFVGGEASEFDVFYPCLGCGPRSDLGKTLNMAVSSEGGVLVDAHMRTSVEGLYAAGDVLHGLDQIASACGQAAIAATDIHNALRRSEQLDIVRGAGPWRTS